MATVNDLLATKGARVLAVDPQATVLDAACLMNAHKIGSLVVAQAGRLCGIITERDILQRVVVHRLDPSETRVESVMTREVVCGHRHTALDEVRVVMKERRIRHLPIVESDGQLCGLISIGDLNAHEAHSKDVTIHQMQAYISGQY